MFFHFRVKVEEDVGHVWWMVSKHALYFYLVPPFISS